MTKTKITEEDIATFRDSVKNVKPLIQTQLPKQPSKKIVHQQLLKKSTEEFFFDNITIPEITAEEIINFARSGLQHKVLRQLTHGQLHTEAVLDLHGMTTTQAATALTNFINYCQQQQFRSVLIIHGKGRNATPIIKNKVNNWLRQLPIVLAFHSAKPADGGTGALYVLLRKKL